MAKKKDDLGKLDKLEEQNEGIVSKILTLLIALFIVIIWLAILGLLIKYDVGSFGSTVLRPVLKDVPVINRVLPNVEDEVLAEENDYPYRNLSEAMARINELEAMVAEGSGQTSGENASYIAELEAEVERLKTFEEEQQAFEEQKKEFNEQIVFGDGAPDISEYQAWYESLDPTTAEELYRQVVEQEQQDTRIQAQADIFATMKPAAAASVLETMTGDLDLVSNILLSMGKKKSAAILAAMDSTMAAKITKKMTMLE